MTKTEQLQATIDTLSGGKRALREMLEQKKATDPDSQDPTLYHWLTNVHKIMGSLIEDIQIEERQRIEKEIRALAAIGGFDVQLLTKEGKKVKQPRPATSEKVIIETKRGDFIIKAKRGKVPEMLVNPLKAGIKVKIGLGDLSNQYDVGLISKEEGQKIFKQLESVEY
ncbi:hypothetical protein [Shewanella algae]|uniref:hypothetical protein n=1 Tax=Shewanella algae TaxID=38313 RepID=UPI003004F6AE